MSLALQRALRVKMLETDSVFSTVLGNYDWSGSARFAYSSRPGRFCPVFCCTAWSLGIHGSNGPIDQRCVDVLFPPLAILILKSLSTCQPIVSIFVNILYEFFFAFERLEVSVNTACFLGRPSGVSVLSLAELTLGKIGAVFSAASYTLLHYAILTAYTSQGGAMLVELFKDAENYTHFGETLNISSMLAGALFAGLIGGSMYALSARMVERINNVLVGAVLATFIGVVWAAGTHVDLGRLFGERHWDSLVHGQILSVLFVSCVYHNVVSSITMRLEGNREKIRRVIVGGTAVPVMMFLIYNAAILGSGGVSARNEVAVAVFSLLAVATSFVGFVEGLTDLWTDVRLSGLGESQERVTQTRYRNFLATLVPPVVFTALSPDVFLQALDAAGTYGIAVLFGGLPAAMAWKNRRRTETKEFGRMVGGGDWVLAAMGVVPILLIGNKVWEGLRHVV